MQLNYQARPVQYGCEGEKSDSSFSNIISRINTDTVTIEYGRLVCFGEKDGCVLAKSKDDIEKRPLGISVGEWREIGHRPGFAVSVLRQGRVFVGLENDVKNGGDPVWVNPANGCFGAKAEGFFQLKGACFMQAGLKGDVIEMEINILGGAQ